MTTDDILDFSIHIEVGLVIFLGFRFVVYVEKRQYLPLLLFYRSESSSLMYYNFYNFKVRSSVNVMSSVFIVVKLSHAPTAGKINLT